MRERAQQLAELLRNKPTDPDLTSPAWDRHRRAVAKLRTRMERLARLAEETRH